MGILVYLSVSGLLLMVIGTALLIWHMQHPQRKTVGYALAKGLPTDPGELGLKFVERGYVFEDGTATQGWEIEGGKPGGPTVIVTHGWNSSKHHGLRHVPGVVDYAGRVVVYDMRGHGESTAKSCTLGMMEQKDLLWMMAEYTRQDGGVVLLGSSMGAGVSIAAAALASESEAAAHEGYKQQNGPVDDSGIIYVSEESRSQTVSDLLRSPSHTQLSKTGGVSPGAGIIPGAGGVIAEGAYRWPMEPVWGHFRLRGWPSVPFVWLAGLYLRWRFEGYRGFDRLDHASRLRCPLLVIHGSEDPICPVESARQIAAAAANATYVEFDGAGHEPLSEHNRKRFDEAVKEFFRAVDRSEVEPVHE